MCTLLSIYSQWIKKDEKRQFNKLRYFFYNKNRLLARQFRCCRYRHLQSVVHGVFACVCVCAHMMTMMMDTGFSTGFVRHWWCFKWISLVRSFIWISQCVLWMRDRACVNFNVKMSYCHKLYARIQFMPNHNCIEEKTNWAIFAKKVESDRRFLIGMELYFNLVSCLFVAVKSLHFFCASEHYFAGRWPCLNWRFFFCFIENYGMFTCRINRKTRNTLIWIRTIELENEL